MEEFLSQMNTTAEALGVANDAANGLNTFIEWAQSVGHHDLASDAIALLPRTLPLRDALFTQNTEAYNAWCAAYEAAREA